MPLGTNSKSPPYARGYVRSQESKAQCCSKFYSSFWDSEKIKCHYGTSFTNCVGISTLYWNAHRINTTKSYHNHFENRQYQTPATAGAVFQEDITLPKTKKSPKMDSCKTTFLLGPGLSSRAMLVLGMLVHQAPTTKLSHEPQEHQVSCHLQTAQVWTFICSNWQFEKTSSLKGCNILN